MGFKGACLSKVFMKMLVSSDTSSFTELLGLISKLFIFLASGVRRIFQWGVSGTSHRDDVSFSDVTAIIMP